MAKDSKGMKERIRAIVSRESRHCIGNDGGELSRARTDLKEAYLGYGYGVDKERAGRGLSTYVDRTMMETIEWAKPGLFRVFGNEEIVRFDPRSPEEEQAAEDATVYINQVVFGRRMFQIIHNVLADGLYQRVGWCIAHAPKKEKQQVDQYTGLTEQEAIALISQSGISSPEEVESVSYPDPQFGTLFDLTLRTTREEREIRIDPIPSERVIISEDAADVESARFVAHWEIKTASDLRKEGYSQALIDELPTESGDDEMPETRVTREVNASSTDAPEGTGALKRFKIWEAWTECDLNGDGIAEKVKVTYCGDDNNIVVLDFEEWPLYRAPLFNACSLPLPHAVVGLCLGDLVMDLQSLKTEMTRQYLDGLAFSNQAEIVVRTGAAGGDIDMESLLSRGPGNVIRAKGDAEITPLPVVTSSGEALQGIELANGMTERRTGISSRTQSIQADTLQNTATGASIMDEAVNQRLELIARVFAEMFFKPLGRYVLHLVHKYHNKPVQIRLKGRFMDFDPRRWDPDMDISVAVGLGTGNRQRLVATYQGILGIQQQMITQLGKNSPVRLTNLIYTCHKMAEAAGLEAPERFFGTEEQAAQAEQAIMNAPEQPSPDIQKLQLEQQKAQAKQQLDVQKAQTEAQRKAYETQAKTALERQKVEGQLALKAMELQGEKELDATRLMMGERGPELTNLRGV